MSEITLRKMLTVADFDLPSEVAVAIEKKEITKAELGAMLNRRVVERKRPDESFHQAYSRLLADGQDYAGAEVFKAYRRLDGLDEAGVALVKALDDARVAFRKG